MQCIQCKKEFEPIRATAKFCSAKCRKLAFQVSVPKDDKISVPLSVPDTDKVSVPPVSTPVSNETPAPVSLINKTPDETPEIISDKLGQPKQILAPESKLTAEELYAQIDSFKGGNEWANSVFYKELQKRLDKLTIKQLRDQGFYVPSWKLNGCKCPF